MSNHIHMIVRAEGELTLSEVLRDIKCVWQKVDYLHQNPVRAACVEKAEDHLYSSARNYAFENQGCLLEVDLLDPYLPGSSFVYLPGYDAQE